jgi:hypothetical protein
MASSASFCDSVVNVAAICPELVFSVVVGGPSSFTTVALTTELKGIVVSKQHLILKRVRIVARRARDRIEVGYIGFGQIFPMCIRALSGHTVRA